MSCRPTCVLLIDISRNSEHMFDDITHLMSSSHLPGLFKQEELDTIVRSLKPVARTAGIQWSEIDRTGGWGGGGRWGGAGGAREKWGGDRVCAG